MYVTLLLLYIAGHLNQSNNQNISNSFASPSNAHLLSSPSSDDLRYHGTELVMLYDYKVRRILQVFINTESS